MDYNRRSLLEREVKKCWILLLHSAGTVASSISLANYHQCRVRRVRAASAVAGGCAAPPAPLTATSAIFIAPASASGASTSARSSPERMRNLVLFCIGSGPRLARTAFSVRTKVAIKTSLPVQVSSGNLPFGNILKQLRGWLTDLATI